jgi:hypothetical protein
MYKIENPVSADACMWCMYVLVNGGEGVAGEEEYTLFFIICLIKFDLKKHKTNS